MLEKPKTQKAYLFSTLPEEKNKRLKHLLATMKSRINHIGEVEEELLKEIEELVDQIEEEWIEETDPRWTEKGYKRYIAH